MKWLDISELGIRGKAWQDTGHVYNRLPARAEGVATEKVWGHAQKPAGMYVDFVTNADEITTRTILRQLPPANELYARYLDLYCRDADNNWRWAGCTRGRLPENPEPTLISGISKERREWRLYLPINFIVDRIEIGIPDDATIEPAAPDERRPIVIYGTSIVHGVSGPARPGMIWPSIVERRLNWPIVNLGFSGAAKMEPPLGEIFTDLDPTIFVIDPLANMTEELVMENAEQFLRIYAEARPTVPLLLIEDREVCDAWLKPDWREAQQSKRKAFEEIAKKLHSEGCKIEYIHGEGLLGFDSEATTDRSHPNELGCVRYADVVTPILLKMLGDAAKQAM